MGKFADRYFQIHPWVIAEEGFDPAHAQVSESVFSLGNEYTGLRGYFEEGYSGESLQGSYLNGVYERRDLPKSGYKGMLPFTEFMVNTVDWVYCRISCNGKELDLAKSDFSDFCRELDLRTGVLIRRFIWQADERTRLEMCFERFLSMEREQFGGQRVSVRALTGSARLSIRAGLDFTRPHVSMGRSMFRSDLGPADGTSCEISGSTLHTQQTVWAAVHFNGLSGVPSQEEGIAANQFDVQLESGQSCCLERVAALVAVRNEKERETFSGRIARAREQLEVLDYEALKAESATWWARQWELSDIRIDGDEANQQGIRFCIFQLHQTLHTAKYGAVFGAKGLTGEAYNGNTFWDSEVYCLPFYLFNNPSAAKSILQFRYDTLAEAKERAAALDCKGAFYPIATISGKECCDLWQHASLQLQASTGVAYGLWNYVHQTGDVDFLYGQGVEMLVEISRMLASRGDFDPVTGQYGYYCVMGPDEFQMMVHHNAYTNFMGKKTLEFTAETLAALKEHKPNRYAQVGVTPEETADWSEKAKRMYIPYDEETMLFEQHAGYFHLPHKDISNIPAEEFPLYSHWSYERIYRNDMLKQPDVLMFMMLYGSQFTDEQLKANFDFYEPRCIHESSLSPSIHSILACRLGRAKKAGDYFGFATRMDLDDYNRNACEGLHTTSIAGAWMNIVYGFGGLRSDGAVLELSPSIPESWNGYAFSLRTGGGTLRIRVTAETASLSFDGPAPLPIRLYGQEVTVTAEISDFPIARKEPL